jgi:purine-binding chemotaxis protein CheW
VTPVSAPRAPTPASREHEHSKVFTVLCGNAQYGLPIDAVLTIFRTQRITPAPLAPREILGLINLRGKIVTATSLRRILGLPDVGKFEDSLAICIERGDEQFALLVDDVGDVVSLSEALRVVAPPNANSRRAALTSGVFRLNDVILPVLDVDALFDFEGRSERALARKQKDSI